MIQKLNLKKGNRLYVEGKLAPGKETGGPRAWIASEGGNSGKAQAAFIVRADPVIALDGRKNE